jgi:transposase
VTTAPADEITALQTALAAEREARQQAEARAASAEALVDHYKLLIAKLRREQYGQSSERGRKLLDQLELHLEEAAASAAEDEAAAAPAAGTAVDPFTRREPVRAPFPANLPRERVVIPAPTVCPLLRRQARQARRDDHRDPGGRAAAMEGDPDGSGEVHLPRL